MRGSSPLRYPGGKSSLSSLLQEIRRINGLGSTAVAEPFAGGAGAALSLLFLEETSKIYINDVDESIHDFWWTLVNRPMPFLKLLKSKRVSMAEWQRQRETYRSTGYVSRLKRGFAAFYLNRCNRSGIIMNGGPIGGVAQTGIWKIDARFNKKNLLERCERVSEYSGRISVSKLDGVDFIRSMNSTNTMLFIDPPYYEKGQTLYLNSLDSEYHSSLARELRKLDREPWVLTYDDCSEIRKLYSAWANVHSFGLSYAAAKKRRGREILITPKWMTVPTEQDSAAIEW